jgi:hypothetical protein
MPNTNIPRKNIPITKTTSIEIKALKRALVSLFSKQPPRKRTSPITRLPKQIPSSKLRLY